MANQSGRRSYAETVQLVTPQMAEKFDNATLAEVSTWDADTLRLYRAYSAQKTRVQYTPRVIAPVSYGALPLESDANGNVSKWGENKNALVVNLLEIQQTGRGAKFFQSLKLWYEIWC